VRWSDFPPRNGSQWIVFRRLLRSSSIRLSGADSSSDSNPSQAIIDTSITRTAVLISREAKQRAARFSVLMPREAQVRCAHVYLLAGKSTGNFNNGDGTNIPVNRAPINHQETTSALKGDNAIAVRAMDLRFPKELKQKPREQKRGLDFRAFHCALIYPASSTVIRRRFPFFYLYFRIKGARWVDR